MKKVPIQYFHDAGRSKMKDIIQGLRNMQRGEVVEVSKYEYDDTGIATPFTAYIHQYFRPSRNIGKFQVRSQRDKSGWLILREK